MGMTLNSMFIAIFVILGLFTVLYVSMPSEFFQNQINYEVPITQEKDVATYFSANNITLYQNSWSFNLSLGGMEYNQAGLPDGHRVEVQFVDQNLGYLDYLEIRHASPSWFFGLWLEHHSMVLDDFSLSKITNTDSRNFASLGVIYKDALLDIAGDTNSSSFTVYCEHISMSFVVLPINSSISLSDSFDAGILKY